MLKIAKNILFQCWDYVVGRLCIYVRIREIYNHNVSSKYYIIYLANNSKAEPFLLEVAKEILYNS